MILFTWFGVCAREEVLYIYTYISSHAASQPRALCSELRFIRQCVCGRIVLLLLRESALKLRGMVSGRTTPVRRRTATAGASCAVAIQFEIIPSLPLPKHPGLPEASKRVVSFRSPTTYCLNNEKKRRATSFQFFTSPHFSNLYQIVYLQASFHQCFFCV